jgi:two-component system catabolic regulation response regulator CreB
MDSICFQTPQPFKGLRKVNKPNILIVEDEPAIADTIQYALETEGFDTIHHGEGKPVLACLSEMDIHLVILDIGLPDINGLELFKEIRKISAVPVIFLTARSDEIDRVLGLELGADDYVTKPFSPRELSARVKAVLRRSGTTFSPPEKPSVDTPFSVDEVRHKISYCNQMLELSRYEFNILKTFVRRPGQVFTRDHLMELVWDEPESSMDRTVDAHIKNIRNKLKKIKPEIDPIITHRGVGYSLKEDL